MSSYLKNLIQRAVVQPHPIGNQTAGGQAQLSPPWKPAFPSSAPLPRTSPFVSTAPARYPARTVHGTSQESARTFASAAVPPRQANPVSAQPAHLPFEKIAHPLQLTEADVTQPQSVVLSANPGRQIDEYAERPKVEHGQQTSAPRPQIIPPLPADRHIEQTNLPRTQLEISAPFGSVAPGPIMPLKMESESPVLPAETLASHPVEQNTSTSQVIVVREGIVPGQPAQEQAVPLEARLEHPPVAPSDRQSDGPTLKTVVASRLEMPPEPEARPVGSPNNQVPDERQRPDRVEIRIGSIEFRSTTRPTQRPPVQPRGFSAYSQLRGGRTGG